MTDPNSLCTEMMSQVKTFDSDILWKGNLQECGPWGTFIVIINNNNNSLLGNRRELESLSPVYDSRRANKKDFVTRLHDFKDTEEG